MEGLQLSLVPPRGLAARIAFVFIVLGIVNIGAFNMASADERWLVVLICGVIDGFLLFDFYRHLTCCQVRISDDHLHLSGRRGTCKVPLEWVVDVRSRIHLLGDKRRLIWSYEGRNPPVLIYVRLARDCRYGRVFHFSARTSLTASPPGAETIDEIWSYVIAKQERLRAAKAAPSGTAEARDGR